MEFSRIKQGILRIAIGVAVVLVTGQTRAEDRISYQDHVRPILASNCLSCHNTDKRESGLDLSNFRNTMSGGSSGAVISPGDPDGSRLFRLISHAEEPKMPPLQARIADDHIATIRAWIEQGCRETKDSASQKREGPKVAFEIDVAADGAADALYPYAFPKRPFVQSAQSGAVFDLAAHPGSHWLAIAGQKQLLAYDLRDFELLGVLPYEVGFPHVVRFSRNGRLLLAAGGVGATKGDVRIWNSETGAFVGAFGEEFDEVRAADIDKSQRHIALGGSSGIVKIHGTDTGELLHRYEKHTDWITSVSYSPDGILLATADRAGGLFVWEADSHAEFYTLRGHTSAITDLSWRADSNVLASCDESGQVRLWEMHGGTEFKKWIAHNPGALSVDFVRDGRIVTGGRDKVVRLWDGDGKKLRDYAAFEDIVIDAVPDSTGNRIIAADLRGTIRVLNIEDGTVVSEIDANPPTFEEQKATAQVALDTAVTQLSEKSSALETAKQAAATALATYQAASNKHDMTQAAAGAAEAALKEVESKLREAEQALAGSSNSDPDSASQFAQSRQSLATARSAAQQALEQAKTVVANAATRRDELSSQRDRTKHEVDAVAGAVQAAEKNRVAATAQMAKWNAGAISIQLSEAQTALVAAQESLAKSVEKADSARRRMTAGQWELDEARHEQNRLPKKIDERMVSVQSAEQAVAARQARVTELEKVLETRRSEHAAFEASTIRLAESSKDSPGESKLAAAVQKAQEALAILAADVKDAETAVGAATQELQTAQAELATAKASVERATLQQNSLPQKIMELEAAVAAAEAELNTATAESESLSQRVTEAQQSVDLLKKQHDEQLEIWINWRKNVVQ